MKLNMFLIVFGLFLVGVLVMDVDWGGGKVVQKVKPYFIVCRVPHGEGVKNVVFRTDVKYPFMEGVWVFKSLDTGEKVASSNCHFQRK